jgi:Cu-Zn family superoxide dismutase
MKAIVYLTSALLSFSLVGTSLAKYPDHADSPVKAIAIVVPGPNQKVGGTVNFTQVDDGVRIVAHITGLTPNSQHGFHIHEFGDASSPDLMSTGGHYNPWGAVHGGPHSAEHHAGDLGNLKTDDKGVATADVVMRDITIAGKNPILGRAIIVHAKPDDLKTNPAGDAGPRIAYGIIGLAKPPQE